jgi:hypothetical protein
MTAVTKLRLTFGAIMLFGAVFALIGVLIMIDGFRQGAW